MDEAGGQPKRSWSTGEYAAPSGITLQRHIDGLWIVRRWRSKAAIGPAVFAALWDAMVVWFYVSADGPDPVFSCMALPFALFGAGVTYFTVCLVLNQTVIDTSGGLLSVRHRPLPWRGKRLAVIDVDHLYCEESAPDADNPAHDYLLGAVTRNGKRVTLLSAREEPEQVLFLVQVINDWLRTTGGSRGGQMPH